MSSFSSYKESTPKFSSNNILFKEKNIFSYKTANQHFPGGNNIIVLQNEFGFSILVKIEEILDKVTVTGFFIQENEFLKIQSLSLYDASIVEIIIQSLHLIYKTCKLKQIQELYFNLEKKEIEHLSSFRYLFTPFKYINSRVCFILDLSKASYLKFKQKSQVIGRDVYKELWARQKHDYIIRRYLQNHEKGKIFPKRMTLQSPFPHSALPFIRKDHIHIPTNLK